MKLGLLSILLFAFLIRFHIGPTAKAAITRPADLSNKIWGKVRYQPITPSNNFVPEPCPPGEEESKKYLDFVNGVYFGVNYKDKKGMFRTRQQSAGDVQLDILQQDSNTGVIQGRPTNSMQSSTLGTSDESRYDDDSNTVSNDVTLTHVDRPIGRITKRNNFTPWACSTEYTWTDLGPNHYPRFVKTAICTSGTCFNGFYHCAPRQYTLKVLKVLESGERQTSAELPHPVNNTVKFINVQVITCCECRVGPSEDD